MTDKFLFITGSFPPDVCGVGDYTYNILNSQIAKEKKWSVFYKKDWRLNHFLKYIYEINSFKYEAICLQYPTQGYGWSLLPHLLCIYYSLFTRKSFTICIHELSNSTSKYKIASAIFLLFSNFIIFTTEFEKKYVLKKMPFVKKKSYVIKICSNISPIKECQSYNQRSYDLIYFGHIRPLKGLESFLDIATELLDKKATLKIAIIGQVPDGYNDYFLEIKRRCDMLKINILQNLPNNQVSDFLNNSKYAYLPFPDGISERRGSFLACIANGTNVITTKGRYLTDEISNVVYFIEECDLLFLINLFNSPSDIFNKKQALGLSYIKKNIPSSWNEVANEYLSFINK